MLVFLVFHICIYVCISLIKVFFGTISYLLCFLTSVVDDRFQTSMTNCETLSQTLTQNVHFGKHFSDNQKRETL